MNPKKIRSKNEMKCDRKDRMKKIKEEMDIEDGLDSHQFIHCFQPVRTCKVKPEPEDDGATDGSAGRGEESKTETNIEIKHEAAAVGEFEEGIGIKEEDVRGAFDKSSA